MILTSDARSWENLSLSRKALFVNRRLQTWEICDMEEVDKWEGEWDFEKITETAFQEGPVEMDKEKLL